MCQNYVQINSYIPFLECRLFLEALLFVLLCDGEQNLTCLKQYSVYCHCFAVHTDGKNACIQG